MAQLILIGNAVATSALAVAEAGGNSVTVYFDDSSNVSVGVLQTGNVLYTTYTPEDNSDPNNIIPESYTNPYDPTGGSALWHFATDPASDQLTVRIEGDSNNTLGEVLTINAHSYDTLTSNVANVDEGGSVIFTVATTNIPNNTTVLYSISGTGIDVNDFNPPLNSLTGNFTINSDTASVTFTLDEDVTTESAETLILQLAPADDNDVATGALSHSVTINDTSVTPVNNAPTTNNQSFNVTQNSDPADSVTINLQQLTQDLDGDPLIWKIVSLPVTGTLRDNYAPATAITAGQLPYELQVDGDGNNYIVKYHPGNTVAGAVVNFTYKAEDDNGGISNVGTITINVDAPQNQPPTGSPITRNLVADGTTNSATFTRVATDPEGLGMTYNWCNASGVTTGLPSLNHGALTQVGGETFQYTQNSGLYIAPGSNPSTLTDIFYYKANDGTDDSAPILVTVNNNSTTNTPPVWKQNGQAYTAPSNAIAIVAGDPFNVTGLTTTDVDLQNDPSQTPSYSVNQTSGTGTVAPTYSASTQTFSVNGVTAGSATVKLIANDGAGGVAELTYQFTITEVPYRGIQYSTFSNSDQSACSLTKSTGSDQYYYDTSATVANGGTFLANLAVGNYIYEDDDLQATSRVIPPSASSTWISVEETSQGTVKALQLNASTGAIESILNCTTTGGAAWPLNVTFNSSITTYCDNDPLQVIQGEAWQNVADGATLAQVVAADGQLFSSEYYANQYAGQTAPASFILAEGAYRDYAMAANTYYYWDAASGWLEDANAPGTYLLDCPTPITYITKSLDVRYYSADPTNIGAVCNAIGGLPWVDVDDERFDLVTIHFRWDQAEANQNPSLLDLAKFTTANGTKIQVFATAGGAVSQNYSLLQPSSVLLDTASGGFVLWDNDDYTGYDGTYNWFAFDTNNVLEQAVAGSQLGTCSDGIGGPLADYQRDGLWGVTHDLLDEDGNLALANSIQVGIATGSKNSLFYAFYACEPQLDPGIPGGQPYYPVYIVDGMADVEQFNESGVSYINDFMKALHTGNKDVRAQVKIDGKCFTYTNYIAATNIEEAVDLMQTEIDIVKQSNITGGGSGDMDAKAISINAVDFGLGSQTSVIWRNFTQGEEGTICYSCASGTQGTSHNWATYTFPAMDNAEVLDRTAPNFNLEENYTLDNVSKPLLRTNPKLTTNAKLVVNSTDQIFLESIDATKELASVEYKKWALNPEGQWSQDLYKFYKSSSTPSKIMYATRADYSDFTVQDSFDKQIEEVYHYGTTYNYSKLHTEELRMLAPIWLDKDIPKKFVVFRVNDPVGEMDFDTRSNFDNIQEILKNSEIIKTFDLTTDSSIGKYIRNHVNSESFPQAPIQFNFEKREKSSFNGIDLGKGGFTRKGEYLHKDFVRADSPLIASNEMITDGFERNKLACANLINMEFLFNDHNATDYSVNRYFGLYVNDIDSGYGSISSANNGEISFKNLNSYINDLPSSAIPSFKHVSTTPTLAYLNISDEFYKISTRARYDINAPFLADVIVEDNNNQIPAEVKTAPNGNSIDIVKNDLPGFDFVKFTVTGTPAVNDRFTVFESRESVYSIKFLRHIPNESWKMSINIDGAVINVPNINIGINAQGAYAAIKNALNAYRDNIVITYDGQNTIFINEINASLQDLQLSFTANGAGASSIAKVTQMQTSVNLDSSTFFATHSLTPGTYNGNFYSLEGTTSEIAKAIVGCINNSSINFTAIIDDGSSDFYIKNAVSGYKLLQSGILIPTNNANNFITLNNRDLKTVNDPNGLLKLSENIIDNNFVHYMNGGNSAGKSVLVTKDSVSDVAVGNMLSTTSVGVYNEIIDIVDDITTPNTIYQKLILDKKNYIESGEQKVYSENIARLGLFSAYDIHDMNFDFYDVENSELKELEYETPAIINYEPERSQLNTLEVFGTDYDISDPYTYFSGINDRLGEETESEYNEVKLFTEYDRLQENNLKEFVIQSRVVPNINKWVLKDSLTVREQPYYLNANEAFGRTNFSPDFNSVGRDRLGMTHEWFYMDKLPKYLDKNQLNETFSYVNFLSGFELKPSHFKSTSYNYFDKFMITDGFEVKDQYDIKSFIKTNLKKKYTLISGGNDASFASTVFKGIKVDFKNRKEFVNTKASEFVKTSEFNGYKFSTVVLVRGGSDNNGIQYEIIQNKTFKFVVFLITVSLDDLWIDGSLNRKLLYEMNHSFVWNHEDQNFSYSDVGLSGALNLNNINFTNPNDDDYLIATGINHADGSEPSFLNQINADDNDIFGNIEITVTDSTGPVTFVLKIQSVDDQNQITLAGGPEDLNGNPVNVSNIAGYIQNSAEYVYKRGGKNAFTSILDQLSVGSVADLLLLNDGSIVYTTVEEDGTILNNQFELDFENGVEIIKSSNLTIVPDDNKPKTFKLKQGVIGFDIEQGDTYYPFLVRHNGNYTVDTRPVVTFTDTYSHFKTNTLQTTLNETELNLEEPMYKHSLTNAEEIKFARDYYKRYNRCGTSFNLGFIQDFGVHDTAWGIIKNHFYRKVNETNSSGVTKLSRSTDKLPLYPLIGEIAIDKKDVNVFRSSWDKNYYTRSLSGGANERVPGTFETKEERSYLGSTIMKVKDSYNMINFTSYKTNTQEQQDRILANNDEKYDVVLFEDKKYVYMDFYITKTLNKLLSSEGVLDSINKFVSAADSAGDKTTTKDDARLYVENNLLNTFNLDMIKIYTSRVKGVDSEIISSASVENLDDGGYMNDTNFTFKSHEQKPLNFRLIYNKRLGYSYRIKPMVKIKS